MVTEDIEERRRREDLQTRQDEFRLHRDKVLLALGVGGLVSLGIAAVFLGFKSDAIALALATTFAALLGIPTALRLDEKRQQEKE